MLALSGEIDLDAGPAVRACLHELTDSGVRHVIVELRQVDFVDSIGLGVLLAASRRLRDADQPGSLRLVCTNERVIKVFAVNGLLQLFRCTTRSSMPAPLTATTPPARPATTAAASTPGQQGRWCQDAGYDGWSPWN